MTKRKQRYLHPDYRMTRFAWLAAAIMCLELGFLLWILGALRPLS